MFDIAQSIDSIIPVQSIENPPKKQRLNSLDVFAYLDISAVNNPTGISSSENKDIDSPFVRCILPYKYYSIGI